MAQAGSLWTASQGNSRETVVLRGQYFTLTSRVFL
jgi:hypothetical protein